MSGFSARWADGMRLDSPFLLPLLARRAKWLGRVPLAAALAAALGLAGYRALGRPPTYAGEPLSHWLAVLAGDDYRQKNRAELALRSLGAEAVPELTLALRARDSRLVALCQAAAAKLGAPPKPRVPAARIREQAAYLLARLGPKAAAATMPLISRLSDEDSEAARAAQAALRRIGPSTVPSLVAALRQAGSAARCRAAELLASQQDFGPALCAAIGPLIGALRDRDAGVRAQAAASLGAIGRDTPGVAEALARALTDPADHARLAATRALGELGPVARPVAPALLGVLRQPNPALRVEAARARWRILHGTEEVLPVLTSALRNPQTHWQAALALAEIGAPADEAIPALLDALQTEAVHRPSRTPASAALALSRMSAAAVPGLTSLLQHEKPSVRIGAALALGGHGAEAREAVPGLLAMLEEPDGEARIVAANALGAIGPQASAALPTLAALGRDGDEYVRAAALAALNKVSPPARAPAAQGVE